MKNKTGFTIVMIFSVVLSSCLTIAAGALFGGVCFKSLLVGILSMMMNLAVLVAAAYAFFPKTMRVRSTEKLMHSEAEEVIR